MMTVKPNIILTNTRLAISIIAPLIMILYFFFQLQADTRVNAQHIERNMEAVSKMEGKVEKMEESMNTLVVDIREDYGKDGKETRKTVDICIIIGTPCTIMV
jgi:hypothetical protein